MTQSNIKNDQDGDALCLFNSYIQSLKKSVDHVKDVLENQQTEMTLLQNGKSANGTLIKNIQDILLLKADKESVAKVVSQDTFKSFETDITNNINKNKNTVTTLSKDISSLQNKLEKLAEKVPTKLTELINDHEGPNRYIKNSELQACLKLQDEKMAKKMTDLKNDPDAPFATEKYVDDKLQKNSQGYVSKEEHNKLCKKYDNLCKKFDDLVDIFICSNQDKIGEIESEQKEIECQLPIEKGMYHQWSEYNKLPCLTFWRVKNGEALHFWKNLGGSNYMRKKLKLNDTNFNCIRFDDGYRFNRRVGRFYGRPLNSFIYFISRQNLLMSLQGYHLWLRQQVNWWGKKIIETRGQIIYVDPNTKEDCERLLRQNNGCLDYEQYHRKLEEKHHIKIPHRVLYKNGEQDIIDFICENYNKTPFMCEKWKSGYQKLMKKKQGFDNETLALTEETKKYKNLLNRSDD